MSLQWIIESMNVGGVLAIFIIIASLIQISPLKLDPFSWLGDQLNKNIRNEVNQRMDKSDATMEEVRQEIQKTQHKLDEHIAQSLRTKIIGFQDDVLQKGMLKTQAQWHEILRACGEYEHYITDNGLINGDATEAIEFIHQEYQRCCASRDFLNSPVQK